MAALGFDEACVKYTKGEGLMEVLAGLVVIFAVLIVIAYYVRNKAGATQASGNKPFSQQIVAPMALATALAEQIKDYFIAVDSGEISSPAYKRNSSGVLEVWSGTRIEAMKQLWGYGAADAMLLADSFQQKDLIDEFLERKPQLEFPHKSTNEPMHDTLQAIFQVYLYLSEAGTAVADKKTDRLNLKLAKTNIFCDFEEEVLLLREAWREYEAELNGSESLPELPPTLLELLFKDVTVKAKGIALSTKFGPDYMTGIHALILSLKSRLNEEEIRNVENTFKSILEANDPDEVAVDF